MTLRISLILLLAVLCLSCETKKNSAETPTNIPTPETTNPTHTDIFLQNYRTFLLSLDTTQLISSTKAAEEFARQSKTINQIQGDSAYALFKQFQEIVQNTQHTIIEKDNDKYLDLFTTEGKPPKEIKDYYAELKKHGFDLEVEEGYVYATMQPDFHKKYFYATFSPAMQVYFTQWGKEYKEGTVSDGGLVITPKELAQRLVFWEEFERQNPNFIWTKEVKQKQENYTYILINGMDNSPTFDYDSKRLQDDFKDAYRFLAEENKSSKTAELFKEYYAILSKTEFKDSPQAQKFRSKSIN
jgi:hypothetical protein